MPFWIALDRLLTRLRPHREALSLLLDAIVVVLAWQATYLFRLGFERWLSARADYDGAVLLGLTALYLLVLWVFKVPKGVWRFSGFGEVQRIALACTAAGLLGATAVLMGQLVKIPRSVLALHPLFVLMGLTLMRLVYRALYEQMMQRQRARDGSLRRALVLGAGDAGRLLLAGIQHQGWVVVGFLDDDPAKQGQRLAGVPVLGRLADAARLAHEQDATHLIIAMPSATGASRRKAVECAASTHLPVLTVPSSEELQHGRRPEQLRDVQPEDLLGREPVKLDEEGIAETLGGKVVLITGAGGSIGSELCRQVALYGPSRLVLFDSSEFNLYCIDQTLTERFPKLLLRCYIGDVKDETVLARVFDAERPQIVFHAAAYKHVPLMEDERNRWACLANNALGSYRVARGSALHCAERFVLISTDKAVHPTNVMGASKRVAELLVSSLVTEFPATRFMAVRFGNVLGSSGSVIPRFKEQIARGGPLTVTHPDIIRYFMTIPEATRLVLQASAIGQSGQVLVLDMGEPVRIVDLARSMIRLSGREPDEIVIEFTGLRPGEKLFEELLAAHDISEPTDFSRLRIARLPVRTDLQQLRDELLSLNEAGGSLDVQALLRRWLPDEYLRPQ